MRTGGPDAAAAPLEARGDAEAGRRRPREPSLSILGMGSLTRSRFKTGPRRGARYQTFGRRPRQGTAARLGTMFAPTSASFASLLQPSATVAVKEEALEADDAAEALELDVLMEHAPAEDVQRAVTPSVSTMSVPIDDAPDQTEDEGAALVHTPMTISALPSKKRRSFVAPRAEGAAPVPKAPRAEGAASVGAAPVPRAALPPRSFVVPRADGSVPVLPRASLPPPPKIAKLEPRGEEEGGSDGGEDSTSCAPPPPSLQRSVPSKKRFGPMWVVGSESLARFGQGEAADGAARTVSKKKKRMRPGTEEEGALVLHTPEADSGEVPVVLEAFLAKKLRPHQAEGVKVPPPSLRPHTRCRCHIPAPPACTHAVHSRRAPR